MTVLQVRNDSELAAALRYAHETGDPYEYEGRKYTVLVAYVTAGAWRGARFLLAPMDMVVIAD